MLTLEETLETLSYNPDRQTLEYYIHHAWVKPAQMQNEWHFAEIDIARVRLVHHLHRDINIEDNAMDVVLNLLDQLYEMRDKMHHIGIIISRQPDNVREQIFPLLENFYKE